MIVYKYKERKNGMKEITDIDRAELICEEYDIKRLAEQNLKAVIAYLLLCDADLTQAKLAGQLEITPVTLSRLINAENSKIGPNMSTKLVDIINDLDTMNPYHDFNQTLKYFEERNQRQQDLRIMNTVFKYLNKNYGQYHLPERANYLRPNGYFILQSEDLRWTFCTKTMSLENLLTTNVYPREVEYQKADRFTFICTNDTIEKTMRYGCSAGQLPSVWARSYGRISAIELSSDLKWILSEQIMYDEKNEINFPITGDL